MAEIISIDNNTWRIEDGMVRMFVLEGEEKALLIDSGMNTPDAAEIARSVTDKPLMLMNTHADRDHISGNGAFTEFYMSPAEETNYRRAGGTGSLIPVSENDIIDLGNRLLEIIDIPGHTPGSIAILDISKRVLIAGDSVQNGNIFMFGEFRSLTDYIPSMKKLLELKDRFDCIYPSHGTFPVEPELIGKLIEGAEQIAAHECTGKTVDMFGNEVLLYKFDYAGFLCGKDTAAGEEKEIARAYFAGGCFWCITPVYKAYGAEKVVCGYSGGDEPNPKYEDVKAQKTGHRETVMIEYDPKRVSYSKLLEIFLANVDPFDAEGQFIDKGFSYTLAIYYTNEEEKELAGRCIRELEESSGKPVQIALEPFKSFYRAEENHQDYYLKNPEAFEKEMEESGRRKTK